MYRYRHLDSHDSQMNPNIMDVCAAARACLLCTDRRVVTCEVRLRILMHMLQAETTSTGAL